jgi:hypothetical protein
MINLDLELILKAVGARVAMVDVCEASVMNSTGGVAYEELTETVRIKPSTYSSIEEKDYWEAEDPDGTRFLDEKEKKLKIEQGKVDAYRLGDDDSMENPLVNGDFFKDGVGIITEKDLRNQYSTDTGTIFSQENFDKWRSGQGYMNAEELDADRYQKAGERFALDIGNNMRSETHIEDLNEQISNLIPGIQTYIKRHEIGGGWYEGNENPTNKPGGSGGEKVVIVAADLIYEEDGKTRRQFKDGGYITDIHGKMYIGNIDFHPKWGDSDLTKKRLKELYYIYKDKKKEKKENYPIVNIINGIFSDNDPGTVDGGQIGSKEKVDRFNNTFFKDTGYSITRKSGEKFEKGLSIYGMTLQTPEGEKIYFPSAGPLQAWLHNNIKDQKVLDKILLNAKENFVLEVETPALDYAQKKVKEATVVDLTYTYEKSNNVTFSDLLEKQLQTPKHYLINVKSGEESFRDESEELLMQYLTKNKFISFEDYQKLIPGYKPNKNAGIRSGGLDYSAQMGIIVKDDGSVDETALLRKNYTALLGMWGNFRKTIETTKTEYGNQISAEFIGNLSKKYDYVPGNIIEENGKRVYVSEKDMVNVFKEKGDAITKDADTLIGKVQMYNLKML